jgi:hypothetical protein
MTKNPEKILLVEGKQDARVIPYLIEANGIAWEINKKPVVYIRDCEGNNNLVDSDIIVSELQASGLSVLGIIIDADDDSSASWQSIRNASLMSIPDIPKVLPEEGLIHTTPEGIKFGIWIMPDNKMRGMLETFLTYMIPTGNEDLWNFAQEVAQEAKSKGATFKNVHKDKANIYTWLAWQEPPGRQLHNAIMERILNPTHPNAQKFVTWFKTLYDLS